MNLFTADVGQGKVHVYDSGNDKFHGKLPEQNLIDLDIPELKKGDTLIVECAHLREAHKMTMAQPFNWEQLNNLKQNAEERGVTILLFPQKSTPKARKLSGYEVQKDNAKFKKLYGISTDEADTRSIANFLLNDTRAFSALKKFNPERLKDFQEKNNFIFNFIKECNEDISPAKTRGYGFDKNDDYSDAVSEWIKKYHTQLVSRLLDEELVSIIGIKKTKKGYSVDKVNRIYTIVHSILRPNGELRLRHDVNLPPNWQYVKAHYLGCKPFHMNQGVCASNYKHWMRRAVSEFVFPGKKSAHTSDFQVNMTFEQLEELKRARTKVDKMTQKIWYVLRKMIVEDGLR